MMAQLFALSSHQLGRGRVAAGGVLDILGIPAQMPHGKAAEGDATGHCANASCRPGSGAQRRPCVAGRPTPLCYAGPLSVPPLRSGHRCCAGCCRAGVRRCFSSISSHLCVDQGQVNEDCVSGHPLGCLLTCMPAMVGAKEPVSSHMFVVPLHSTARLLPMPGN